MKKKYLSVRKGVGEYLRIFSVRNLNSYILLDEILFMLLQHDVTPQLWRFEERSYDCLMT